MGDILFVVGWALTLGLLVDCRHKARSADWYWLLLGLGPLGGLAYLLYAPHGSAAARRSPVARGPVASPFTWRRPAAPKGWGKPSVSATVTPIGSGRRGRDKDGRVNCSRCMRQVDQLVPYEDGRVKHYACEMCVAEIELRRSPSISFKNLEL